MRSTKEGSEGRDRRKKEEGMRKGGREEKGRKGEREIIKDLLIQKMTSITLEQEHTVLTYIRIHFLRK